MLISLLMSGLLVGCRHNPDAFEVAFVNETERPLFIVFRGPNGDVAAARAPAGEGGLALGESEPSRWSGGTVEVLTTDCRTVGSTEFQPNVVVVIRGSMQIEVLPIMDASAHVRGTELGQDIGCPLPTP